MAETYAYKVRDRAGKLIEGELEGDSQLLVANRLRQMGYVPVDIKPKNAGMNREITIPGFAPKAKLKDVALFSRQFATMINSGLNLLRALNILADQTENKALKATINEVRADVEKGMTLSAAIARHPKVFNRLYVAMIRAGEVGGVLDSVLLQLAETLEKQVELRGKIRAAMTYPVAVFVLVILIVSAMLVFVVPTFQTLYDGLGGTLPLPTRVLLAVSEIVKKWLILIVLFWVAVGYLFKRWISTANGRAIWDTFKLKVPIFGQLVHKTALTRFSRTLSVLLKSGVPILESLEITADTVNNTVMARAIDDVRQGVMSGEAIAKPLTNHAIFPPMVVQMMAVGEETGALDEMLTRLADFFDQEIEALVNSLTSLLEPLMIVVMGGAVGSMVVALYMPMFNIINLIQ